MRIIFVGMHNKPMKMPLCPSTKSGKLIDKIIVGLPPGHPCLKTNLYDVDYYPTSQDEKFALAMRWGNVNKICLSNNDILILLGAEVHNNFPFNHSKTVKIPHPSSQRSHKQMKAYVDGATAKIIAHLTANIKPSVPSRNGFKRVDAVCAAILELTAQDFTGALQYAKKNKAGKEHNTRIVLKLKSLQRLLK